MPLEPGDFIDDLVPTNPTITDGINQGDDHIRLVKQVLRNALPGNTAPLTFQGNMDIGTGSLTAGGDGNFGGNVNGVQGQFTGDVGGANGIFTGQVSAASAAVSGPVTGAAADFTSVDTNQLDVAGISNLSQVVSDGNITTTADMQANRVVSTTEVVCDSLDVNGGGANILGPITCGNINGAGNWLNNAPIRGTRVYTTGGADLDVVAADLAALEVASALGQITGATTFRGFGIIGVAQLATGDHRITFAESATFTDNQATFFSGDNQAIGTTAFYSVESWHESVNADRVKSTLVDSTPDGFNKFPIDVVRWLLS